MASAAEVELELEKPKESCLTKVRKSPGRFCDSLKSLDWHFVGMGVVATLIYWGVSFGYMMIFLTWLYSDFESQRMFNVIFFFSCLGAVLIVTLVKQYFRAVEDSEAEAARKPAAEVNVPKVGDKDWTKNKTGTADLNEAANGTAETAHGEM